MMSMKQVTRLEKKHANGLWRDDQGDYWFYSLEEKRWAWFSGYGKDNLYGEKAGVESLRLNSSLTPDADMGPYTRVVKFDR